MTPLTFALGWLGVFCALVILALLADRVIERIADLPVLRRRRVARRVSRAAGNVKFQVSK